MKKTLHVTNGDHLNDRLLKMSITGDYAVWREMLCEGEAIADLSSADFKKARLAFLENHYPDLAVKYDERFGSQLAIIADAHHYEEVVLWFEYYLFCHVNMLACISFIKSLGYKGGVYLVCSGWIEGGKELHTLTQLSENQLLAHYKNKVLLDNHDLFIADDLWRLYCGNDHLKLRPERAKDSNFTYLSNCISAHKERFPSTTTGLNTLETNMLRLIRKYTIKTTHQLCGYMLNYQGYYGYGDLQIEKMIARMSPFFTDTEGRLTLTEKANNILDNLYNVFEEMKYPCTLGGASKYEYVYNNDNHQLTKVL